MDPEKWKRFIMKIDVNAPQEVVYSAFATAEGLMGWIAMEVVLVDADGAERDAGASVSPGDRTINRWHMGHTEEAEYLEANGDDRLRYTFGEGIVVGIDLEQMEDGSVMVSLEQTQDLSDDDNLKIMLGFKEGWAFYLANLKSVLEGGLDLRNYTHDIEDRVNY